MWAVGPGAGNPATQEPDCSARSQSAELATEGADQPTRHRPTEDRDPLSPAQWPAGTLDVMSATPTMQLTGAPDGAPGSHPVPIER